MNYLIVMPAMDLAVTRRCLDSMAPGVRANVKLIDNTPDRAHAPLASSLYWPITHPPEHWGVGRAWNSIWNEQAGEGLDWVVLLSARVAFGAQGGTDLVDHMEWCDEEKAVYSFFAKPAYRHCWAIHKYVFRDVGTFDENFYPAYFEDTDFLYRMKLAGYDEPEIVTLDLEEREVDGHGCAALAHYYPGKRTLNGDAIRQYYERKWGGAPAGTLPSPGVPQDEQFTHPFNDVTKTLRYWPKATVAELKARYGLEF